MTEIKKIKKLSLANIVALLYALFGFIASFAASIYSLVIVLAQKQTAGKLLVYICTNLGLGFLIALAAAIIAGAAGWLLGFVSAGFYNFLAKSIGGVKIEMAEETFGEVKKVEEVKNNQLFKY
ncbi:MAG TPA: hypothetical protein VMC41_01630 [Candidatus Nanoarchaeia archaeon]|nr:hypothetical protein [Candidatus Nanoarchaeia archaeon]